MNPYEGYRVYGPYSRKDGRQHVILFKTHRDKITVSYPRYLKEIELGRRLLPREEVHHKDEDTTNNSPDNLKIIHGTEHRLMHNKKFYFPP